MTIKFLETCKVSKLNQKETDKLDKAGQARPDKLDRPLVIKLN